MAGLKTSGTGKDGVKNSNSAHEEHVHTCLLLKPGGGIKLRLSVTLHMDITRWATEIRLIIFFAAKDGEAKTRPDSDYDADHELLLQIQI